MISFTVEDVKAAYKATGLRPKLRGFFDMELTEACPLTALATHRLGFAAVHSRIMQGGACNLIQVTSGLTDDECTDFILGVDHGSVSVEYSAHLRDSSAYNLGLAVREAIFGEPRVQ